MLNIRNAYEAFTEKVAGLWKKVPYFIRLWIKVMLWVWALLVFLSFVASGPEWVQAVVVISGCCAVLAGIIYIIKSN